MDMHVTKCVSRIFFSHFFSVDIYIYSEQLEISNFIDFLFQTIVNNVKHMSMNKNEYFYFVCTEVGTELQINLVADYLFVIIIAFESGMINKLRKTKNVLLNKICKKKFKEYTFFVYSILQRHFCFAQRHFNVKFNILHNKNHMPYVNCFRCFC